MSVDDTGLGPSPIPSDTGFGMAVDGFPQRAPFA